MKGLVFITFFLLMLFANTIESRHEPGDHHWRNLIDDKSFHEAIEDLIHSDPNSLLSKNKMDDCTQTLKLEDEKLFVKNIEDTKTKLAEDIPQTTFYPYVVKTKLFAKDIESRPNFSFYPKDPKTKLAKDIEPRPSATFYPEDTKTKLAKDIEPRPSTLFYPDDTKTEFFTKDIEPRPSAKFYADDTKTSSKDIEPLSITFYVDGIKTNLVKDIEPRPSASFYPDNNLKAKEFSADAHNGEADVQVAPA